MDHKTKVLCYDILTCRQIDNQRDWKGQTDTERHRNRRKIEALRKKLISEFQLIFEVAFYIFFSKLVLSTINCNIIRQNSWEVLEKVRSGILQWYLEQVSEIFREALSFEKYKSKVQIKSTNQKYKSKWKK